MDSTGTVDFNSVDCNENTAGASGGCFHGSGAGVINSGTVMRDNEADLGGGVCECRNDIATYA